MSSYTSKKSFINSLNVDRRFLAQFVGKKLNYSIQRYHIIAVINFLFDELINHLSNDNPIIIGNFGKFFMIKLKPHRYYNFIEKKIKFYQDKKILRFKFNKDIQKILTKSLDIAKTFGRNDNE